MKTFPPADRRVNWNRLLKRTLASLYVGLLLTSFFLTVQVAVKRILLNSNQPSGMGTYWSQLGEMDFVAFYIGGKLARTEVEHLYDIQRQTELRQSLPFGATAEQGTLLPFVYPPLFAKLMSPFSIVSLRSAYCLWLATAFVGILSSLCMLSTTLHWAKEERFKALVNTIGFVPLVMNAFIGGQASWIGLLIFTATFVTLSQSRLLTAGLVFSLSYYKPPLFLVALGVFGTVYGRRFLAGFLIGGVLLAVGSIWSIGWEACVMWVRLVSRYTYGQELVPGVTLPPNQGAGIIGLIATLPIDGVIKIGLTVCGIGAASVAAWNLRPPSHATDYFRRWFCFVVIASVTLSLQCIRYDLAILLLPFLIWNEGGFWRIASQSNDNRKITRLLVNGFVTLYFFEWLARGIEFGSYAVNLSSFAAIGLLISLYFELRHSRPVLRLEAPGEGTSVS